MSVRMISPDPESGISVIIGTLLLILITVTAAAGLAVMVSELQKNEMNRQSHLAQVKNEELKIIGVNMTQNGTSFTWDQANVTILNLNTAESRVIGVSLNDRYPKEFTAGGTEYNLTRNEWLPIDATKSEEITINLTTDYPVILNISTDESVHVRVMTSLYNTFERTFQPPVAVMKVQIDTEDLNVMSRDVLVLDGSDSFDDGTINTWNWTIRDLSGESLPKYASGKVARISPSSTGFFPGSGGPFRVNLTVTDDTGMKGFSRDMDIPLNPRFNPPASLTFTKDVIDANNTKITVRITDLSGNPVNDTAVTFLKAQDLYGNLTLDTYIALTVNGTALTNKTSGSGIIRVLSGTLPPREIIV